MRFTPTFLASSLGLLLSGPVFSADNVGPESEQTSNNQSSESVSLPSMDVSSRWLGDTESSGEYTIPEMNTATRLGLSIQETPQSVSVISRQVIDDFKLETINDVAKMATGVSSKLSDSSRSRFSARGFDINNLQIDGVPTAWEPGYDAGETLMDTAIYDRVEIVRGATGLITGAGDPSAAINLVRKRADSREFIGHASVTAGSWDHYQGTVDVSTPLNEAGTVRGRLVGSYRESDSYIDLLEDERKVFYGTLGVDLTDNTLLNVGVSHQEHNPTASTWGGLPAWFSDGTRTDWSRSKTVGADWTRWASEATNYFANIEHQFDSGASLYAAYSKSINDGNSKLLWRTGLPDKKTGLGMTASPSRYNNEREQENIDIYGNLPFSLFGREHEVTLGLMHSEQDFIAMRRYASNVQTSLGNFYEWDGSYPEPDWGEKTPYVTKDNKQTGYYAVSRLSLADPLTLILGSRLTDWEISGMQWDGSLYEFEHDKEVTPYAGLIYAFDDVYSGYVSYTDIFKPQNLQDKNGDYLDPIEGKNYEAGVKAAYLDGRLNATVSVFRIEQDNLGQTDPNNLVPGTINQASMPADGATSKGFDVELAGALTDNWNILLGWSQFRAEDANGDAVNTEFPRRMANLHTTYRMGKLTIGGSVNWESRNYTIANNPQGNPEKLEQESFALANLMARYQISPDLQAQVNVNNLFDEEYYSQIGFYSQYAYGAPRNVTASLRYDF